MLGELNAVDTLRASEGDASGMYFSEWILLDSGTRRLHPAEARTTLRRSELQ